MKINSNNGLLVEGSLDSALFTVITARNARMQIMFPDATSQIVNADKSSFGYSLTDNIVCNVSANNGVVSLVFSRPVKNTSPIHIRMQLFNFSPTKMNGMCGSVGGTTIEFKSLDGESLVLSDNILYVSMRSTESRFIILSRSDFAMLSPRFEIMSTPPIPTIYNVAEGSKPPEFALGVYDESSYSRPRQTRFGIPVISTVPTEPPYTTTTIPPALTLDEQEYLSNGAGPKSRTMYFKAFCNTTLPYTGPNAVPVSLMIYMPNGIDTVAAPIEVQLSTLNGTVYTGNAVFFQEDTVNTVDGICYFNVYMPVNMRIALPLRLQVGYPQVVQTNNNVTMFSINKVDIESKLKKKRSKSKK